MNILQWFTGLFGPVDKILKTVVGSKQERDQQNHDEFNTVQKSYQAEYTNTGGIFNSFVDGINRLVRPLFTFGTIALFVWAIAEPEPFAIAMAALSAIPIELWTIEGTIIAFWFGSKSIFGDRHKYAYHYKAPKIMTKTLQTQEVISDDDTPQVQRSVKLSEIDNDVIRDWLKSRQEVKI